MSRLRLLKARAANKATRSRGPTVRERAMATPLAGREILELTQRSRVS